MDVTGRLHKNTRLDQSDLGCYGFLSGAQQPQPGRIAQYSSVLACGIEFRRATSLPSTAGKTENKRRPKGKK